MNKHGGKRTPGPGRTIGRPPLAVTDKRVGKNISLRPDHAERLRGKNASLEIERALDCRKVYVVLYTSDELGAFIGGVFTARNTASDFMGTGFDGYDSEIIEQEVTL